MIHIGEPQITDQTAAAEWGMKHNRMKIPTVRISQREEYAPHASVGSTE
jgi:hypothetical protein